MKIAVIGCKGLPAKQGGIEHYCQELYTRIATEGHEVDLFARSSYMEGGKWFATDHVGGVNVICLPSLSFKGIDALTNAAIATFLSIFNSYDVIHFHALGPAIFAGLPKMLSSGQIVVTCHGLDWQRSKWGKLSRLLIRLGEKVAVKSADELVVVSQDIQDYFKSTYGIQATYIPTAPATYLDPDPQESYLQSVGLEAGNYILYLSRLVPEKRPDLLIKAFQALKSPRWKLAIAGGACHTQEFTAELHKLAAGDDRIVFTGEIRGKRLSEVMRRAGAFVLPSDLEGLPLVMLEAMREGIPVIGSDIPAHRQLIGPDQERGFLFASGDIQACASVLETAMQSPEVLAIKAQAAQQFVQEQHNWQKITYEKLKLYGRIANAPALVKAQTQITASSRLVAQSSQPSPK